MSTQNVNLARFARNVEWDRFLWFSNTVQLLVLETTTPKLLIFCTTFYETLLHLFFANRWSLKNYAKLFEFHFAVCQMYLFSFGSPWIRNNYMAEIKSWIFQCFGLFFASNREEYLATKMQWKIHNNPPKNVDFKIVWKQRSSSKIRGTHPPWVRKSAQKEVLPHANSSFTIFTSSNLRVQQSCIPILILFPSLLQIQSFCMTCVVKCNLIWQNRDHFYCRRLIK